MDLKLEQEAEEYAWKKKNPFSKEILANELVLSSKTDFIAGANSKYVQIEKIKAQISILEWVNENGFLEMEIEKFQQKLKQLGHG